MLSKNANLDELQRHLQSTLPMARIETAALPGCSEIQLGLINADFPTGPLPAEVMRAVIAEPAYWAFCWGSGLATAQWLLADPEVVQNKVVGDLGSGSGVVAIAATRAGAAQVWACDNDPGALLATQANAAINDVDLHIVNDVTLLPGNLDVLFMADVLYDRQNIALIELAKPLTRRLIIADSRVADVEDPEFQITHQMQALTYPNLGEFDEFKTVSFFNYEGG